jgi:hypothetical protein
MDGRARDVLMLQDFDDDGDSSYNVCHAISQEIDSRELHPLSSERRFAMLACCQRAAAILQLSPRRLSV